MSSTTLKDVEINCTATNVDLSAAQEILNRLPEDIYVIDKFFEGSTLNFTAYLNDVEVEYAIKIIDLIDNGPEFEDVKVNWHLYHDYRTGLDKDDLKIFNEEFTDYSRFTDRTLS